MTKNLKLVKLHMNEYMDDWQKFNETSLSVLSSKRVCKDFATK